MTPEAAADRLDYSSTILSRWERMGGPTGPVADTRAMIRSEIVVLYGMGADHPDLAETVAQLVERYRAMMVKLQH